MSGSDDWLGEWTFGLPNGSMTDEPILIAHLIARSGLKSAGVLVERAAGHADLPFAGLLIQVAGRAKHGRVLSDQHSTLGPGVRREAGDDGRREPRGRRDPSDT
jgi:hypothetical protein